MKNYFLQIYLLSRSKNRLEGKEVQVRDLSREARTYRWDMGDISPSPQDEKKKKKKERKKRQDRRKRAANF